MASTIITKNGTGSASPSSLQQGELAINVSSGKLFYGTSGSSNSVSSSFTFDELTVTNLTTTNLTSSIITASIIETSGSNIFGDDSSDTHLFRGDITASGNISSSGNLIGDDLQLGGEVGLLSSTNLLTISNPLGGELNTVYFKTAGVGIGTTTPGEKLEVIGNISASGNILGSTGSFDYLESDRIIGHTGDTGTGLQFANDTTIINSNGIQVAKFRATSGTIIGSGNHPLSMSGTVVEIEGHITASGNISASGTITANTITAEHITSTDDMTVTDDLIVNGNISASGNYILAGSYQVDNATFANKDTDGTFQLATDVSITQINLGKSNGAQPVFANGSITSSNNISASGAIIGLTGSFTTLEGDTSQATGLLVEGTITASGDISSSGNIYSDNIEILAQGSARVQTITNATDYFGPNYQGPYHTANWNRAYSVESDGNIILSRQETTTGFIVPYSCSLLGFDAITRMNSGETAYQSMSLFTSNANDMDLKNSSTNSPGFTASLACTGVSQGKRNYNSFMTTGSCNVELPPFSVVYPRVKVDSDGSDASMTMDLTYVIKIKRIK